jgi:hypothetical protein
MMIHARPIVAALAAIAVLALGPSQASATTYPIAQSALPGDVASGAVAPLFGAVPIGVVGNAATPGACGTTTGVEGQGGTANENRVCMGAGLSFIGPSVGQIATVQGPTIIGTAVIGTQIVAAGDAAVVGP